VGAEPPIDEVYFDRNQLVLALGRMAMRCGWPVGLGTDPDEPDWPVLYIDTPEGQVSWHLPAAEVAAADWPRYTGMWDGHTVEQKRARLTALISSSKR
jgi:hypothetical protein